MADRATCCISAEAHARVPREPRTRRARWLGRGGWGGDQNCLVSCEPAGGGDIDTASAGRRREEAGSKLRPGCSRFSSRLKYEADFEIQQKPIERLVVRDVARSLEDTREAQSSGAHLLHMWHRSAAPARGGQVNTGEQKREIRLARNVWDEKWLRGLNVDLYGP